MTVLPDAEELRIKTGGQILGGWLSARVERGIERLPSGFVVELTELHPGQAGKAVIEPGSAAQIYLGADLILTGYVDLYSPKYDGGQHVVRIEGRSKTEDVVDCSLAPPLG
jgi:prophage tail gpP-like protein